MLVMAVIRRYLNVMIKLFMVGIPKNMDAQHLKALLDDFGDVQGVTIVTEKETGQSKGYAFADFLDAPGARLAIKELDGSLLDGRTLSVRLADRQSRPRKSQHIPLDERRYEKARKLITKER
jgi:RNA recognition motif-containing protein